MDVDDEGTFSYQGRLIKVNVNTLIDINVLGHGHFGNVMLAEVTDEPDTIRMAVKVSEIMEEDNNNRYKISMNLLIDDHSFFNSD